MVKSAQQVRDKMRDRVATGGKYLEEGMGAGKDPVEVALADIDNHEKKMVDGLKEAQRRGTIRGGLQKAKDRDSWRKSIPTAGAHYEDAADKMVEHAMEDYDERMRVVEAAREIIKKMPNTTRAQKIARSSKYQELTGEGFDKLYNRKG